MNLAQRTITATLWNLLSNGISVVILFFRSILLARLLPVEVFGAYGWASALTGVTVVLVDFGMSAAFLHRAEETEDESSAAAVHFTLKLILTTVWMGILLTGALLFTDGQTRLALGVLTLTTGLSQLVQTPRLILMRRVIHRRLALLMTVQTIGTTIVALGLGWFGFSLWALLSVDVTMLFLSVVVLYVWRPVWKPRLLWSMSAVRYFFGFGGRTVIATTLGTVLDRIDDLWIGAYLGETPLGYYTRAYRFATYPSTIVASPVNSVIGGSFAELKSDRLQLSKTFFRTTAFLVRAGFYLAGLLVLVAPEFIRLVLGVKWLPMLDAFRLMLLFAMLDPIEGAVGQLFVAVGRPEKLMQARLIQLAALVVALYVLGNRWGIVGVALAVDITMLLGMVILFGMARSYVDINPIRLFGIPVLMLFVALVAARWAITWSGVLGSDSTTGIVKFVVFSIIYGLGLMLLERRQLKEILSWLSARKVGKTQNN